MEELGIPYDHRLVELSDVKKDPLTRVNPNGRLPAIEDPNTGIVLWEASLSNPSLVFHFTPSMRVEWCHYFVSD